MTTDIETIAGVLLIEMFVAVMLYGITTTQAYVYWWNYPFDNSMTKKTVLVVWFLETVHTAFCLDMIYEYVITDFGNLARVELIVWSVGATVITAVIIAAVVQSFFIHRIWILSGRNLSHDRYPGCVLVVSSLPGLWYDLANQCRHLPTYNIRIVPATASFTWKIEHWSRFRESIGPLVTLTSGLSLAAVVDFIIASFLIYYLQQGRSGTRRTDHLIKSLQAYVINTVSLTMLVSIAILMTFLFYKSSLLFTGLVEIQSKLYANSLLATLNARERLRSIPGTAMDDAITMHFAARDPTGQVQSVPTRHIDIYQTITGTVQAGSGEGLPNASTETMLEMNTFKENDSKSKAEVLP